MQYLFWILAAQLSLELFAQDEAHSATLLNATGWGHDALPVHPIHGLSQQWGSGSDDTLVSTPKVAMHASAYGIPDRKIAKVPALRGVSATFAKTVDSAGWELKMHAAKDKPMPWETPKVQPFEPLYPNFDPNMGMSPDASPAPIVPRWKRPAGPLLIPGSSVTGAKTFLRVRHVSSKEFTVSDKKGTYMFATSVTSSKAKTASRFDWPSESPLSHFFDTRSGRRLAQLSRTVFRLRPQWEIATYAPPCEEAKAYPVGSDDAAPIWSFGRLTLHIFHHETRWSLQRYQCDGSLIHALRVVRRPHAAFANRYYILDDTNPSAENSKPIGTIDRAIYKENAYDIWMSAGTDLAFMSTLSIIINYEDMLANRADEKGLMDKLSG